MKTPWRRLKTDVGVGIGTARAIQQTLVGAVLSTQTRQGNGEIRQLNRPQLEETVPGLVTLLYATSVPFTTGCPVAVSPLRGPVGIEAGQTRTLR